MTPNSVTNLDPTPQALPSSHQAHRQQVVAAQQLHEHSDLELTPDRLSKALDLVLSHAVSPCQNHTASVPASARWQVSEAPASACFKFRVHTMEVIYTFRGVDDGEVQARMAETLPLLQTLMEACQDRYAEHARRRCDRRRPCWRRR